jgi:hypothetical protein
MNEYRFVLTFKATNDAVAESVANWVRIALHQLDDEAEFDLRREEKDRPISRGGI